MGRKATVNVSWAELADRAEPMGHEAEQHGKESKPKVREKDKVTAKNLYRLLLKQEQRCAISGAELTTDNVSLDHIVPLSQGGEHTMSNVQLVHKIVNRMKGTMRHDEMLDWCRKISQWNA